MSESLNRLIWDIFNNDYTEPEYTGRAMGKVSSSLKNLFFSYTNLNKNRNACFDLCGWTIIIF